MPNCTSTRFASSRAQDFGAPPPLSDVERDRLLNTWSTLPGAKGNKRNPPPTKPKAGRMLATSSLDEVPSDDASPWRSIDIYEGHERAQRAKAGTGAVVRNKHDVRVDVGCAGLEHVAGPLWEIVTTLLYHCCSPYLSVAHAQTARPVIRSDVARGTARVVRCDAYVTRRISFETQPRMYATNLHVLHHGCHVTCRI